MKSSVVSLAETIANVVAGYGVAVMAQMIVFPLFGIEASFAHNLAVGIALTAVSLARSHVLRHFFEGLSQRPNSRDSRAYGQSSTADRSAARPVRWSA